MKKESQPVRRHQDDYLEQRRQGHRKNCLQALAARKAFELTQATLVTRPETAEGSQSSQHER